METSIAIERENHLRWDGTPGHYEVYYMTFNHIKSGSGFWIRYTMTAPDEGAGEPCAMMWFSYFNRENPGKNFALKKKFPIDMFRAETDPFRLSIGGNSLRNGHASGAISGNGHEVDWDLTFTRSRSVHYMLPKFMYRLELADTLALVPHLDVSFAGRITVDGETLEFDGDPGCQTHLWGSEHAVRWAWAHCNSFQEDDSAVFEGLTVQIRRLGVLLPPLNLLFFRIDGKDYSFIDLHKLFSTKGEFVTGRWEFVSTDGNTKLDCKISCRDEDMVEAEYFDPNGHTAYCRNTEVGDFSIELHKRAFPFAPWKLEKTLTATGTAHMEFASRKKDPRVTKEIVEVE